MPKRTVSQGEMVGMAIAAVLIPAIILVASLIYVAFYASGYSLFQKIVIVLIALIVIGVAEALLWMAWAGSKGFMRWPPQQRQ
jgi:hypothetical protein